MAAAAMTGWKLDDEPSFAVNCFPARGVARKTNEGVGSWVVSYAIEQHRRFNTLATPKQKDKLSNYSPLLPTEYHTSFNGRCLDKQFLLNHHHVDSPLDLCSVNISDCDLEFCVPASLKGFENVAYVNASENLLLLEHFRYFNNIRELELPVNGLRNIKIDVNNFPQLQVLDLSYNNLSSGDVLQLGALSNLKVLSLSGNGFNSIHPDLCQNFEDSDTGRTFTRFQNLEILNLDSNNLSDMSVFASLASLPALRELNLDKNQLNAIPYLKIAGEKVISETHLDRIKSAQVLSAGFHHASRADKTTPKSQHSTRSKNYKDMKSLSEISNFSQHRFMLDLSASPPPFQCLNTLSIANNQITDSESVISVAAWPQLQNLNLTGNPIVKKTNGVPPIISHYLNKRLGINVIRFKPKAPPMKPAFVVNRPHRKIRTVVPKIPKQPVDEMLEQYRLFGIEQPVVKDNLDFLEKSKEPEELLKKEEQPKDNVFLTQVQDDFHQAHPDVSDVKTESPKEENVKTQSLELSEFDDLNGSKVKELLEDVRPDPEVFEELGIQGNLRMLHSLLKHPKNFEPGRKRLKKIPKFVYTAKEDKTTSVNDIRGTTVINVHEKREKQLNAAFCNIKHMPGAVVEIPLGQALNGENVDHNTRELAEMHLEKITEKYRVVREESMRASRERKKALEETKEQIKKAHNIILNI